MHIVSRYRPTNKRTRSGCCPVIAFVELVERFSYYGTTVVFTNFIQQPLPAGSHTGAGGKNGQSGALDKGQRASTGNSTLMEPQRISHINKL